MKERAIVLVVEDNVMNMDLTCDLLEFAGFRVCRAESAEVALERVARQRPDVILMDIALPGMDGLEATVRLQADPATRAIPVVAVTASAMRADEERALAAGCRAVFHKPIDTRTFAQAVAAFIETGRPEAGASGSATPAGRPGADGGLS